MWYAPLFRFVKGNVPPTRRPHTGRPLLLEGLEDRCVPAVSIVPDPVNKVLTIHGDNKAQQVSILDFPGATTSINIDTNGDGLLDVFIDTKLFYGVANFDKYIFDLGKGDDAIDIRQMANLATGTRDYQVTDLNGNNSFLWDSNGFNLTAGSRLSLAYSGGGGRDSITGLFNGMSSSQADFQTNVGAGNDQVSLLFRGAMADSNFSLNLPGEKGVDAANIFFQNTCTMNNTIVDMVFDMGQDIDGVNVSNNCSSITNGSRVSFQTQTGAGADVLNYRLNAALGANSSVILNANLGDGDDRFTSTLGYDTFVDDPSSLSVFQVSGGKGNDTMFVVPFTLAGNDAVLNGQLQYFLDGDAGNDSITFSTLDVLGNTGAELRINATGKFLLSINGGNDKDTISTTLFFDPASSPLGTAQISILGNAGNDTVSFSGSDPAHLTYAPLGSALFDGGAGVDTFVLLFNNPLGLVPLTVVNF